MLNHYSEKVDPLLLCDFICPGVWFHIIDAYVLRCSLLLTEAILSS